MKRFFIGLAAVLAIGACQTAFAKNVPVTAITPFSSANPPSEIALRINSNIQVTDDVVLFEGYTVKGKMILQNGSLAFVPYSFVNVHNEEGQFEPQTYGVLEGYVNNGRVVKLPTGASINIGANQMFILNFKDIVPKSVDMPENVTETPTNLVIDSTFPQTIESQRPFARRLPGLPITDVGTMDSTNRYNPAMPLPNILRNRNGEFLR
ncbi:MAG: hypothetical protein II085_04875 [Alphaproteobacteria bacterium]|nr:hypothetical protein [Alphaproteobacteria bacterium]